MRHRGMRITAALAAMLTAGFLAAGTAWAARNEGPRGRGERGAGVRAALEKLDLSAEQETKIRELAEAARPAIAAARERMRTERTDLKTQMDAANPDPTTLGRTMLRLKASREAIRTEMNKLQDATVTVLTPDQRIRFEAYLNAYRTARRGRHGGPRG